ncbi:NAD(P)/FAD-dependent oxidoreductase [bacterium]|nr:NAD(P)/FAD-dependent oxidoreductase [bacterium]
MKVPHRVVIVGGGFAGLNCAKSLANDDRFDVTLIDRQNHHLFQPLLYQVATASLSAVEIARSLRAILDDAGNVSVFLDKVTQIDDTQKTVITQNGDYSYDSLVLATGAHTSYFGKDEWAKHTFGLKTLENSRRIRHQVLNALEKAERSADSRERKRLMTVAIVGGGPTGVELAGAFADLVRRALKSDYRRINVNDFRIILIQSGDRLLKSFCGEHSEYTRERLEKLGVEIILGPRVDEVRDRYLHLNDGREIDAETLIWAAGVAASPLTRCFDCPRDRGGRVEVDPSLAVPGHPHVFAAGDLVSLIDHNGNSVPGLAPAAMQMGRHVAQVIREDLRLQKTRYKSRYLELRPAFRYRDKGIMAIIGKNAAVTQANKLKLKGFPAWLAWLFIHLAFLVGFRNKLAVLLSWAFSYLFDKPAARVFSIPEARETPELD